MLNKVREFEVRLINLNSNSVRSVSVTHERARN